MSDEEYIIGLEFFVHFLSKVYSQCKDTYHDKNLGISSILNPNRRQLTQCEQDEWSKFPLIQGIKLQNYVSSFANTVKRTPIELDEFVKRYNNEHPN